MCYQRFSKHFRQRAAHSRNVGNSLVAYKTLKVALLLGGTVLGIHFSANTFRGNPGAGTPSLSAGPLANAQIEDKSVLLRQHKHPAQHRDGSAFCQAEAQSLTRRLFASNDQLKYSLADHLAKTYRLAPKHAGEIVRTAATVSKDQDVDPFLVLGIIAKESSFNQAARSGYGATGLMQVHAPSHKILLKTMGLDVRNLRLTEKLLQSAMRINVTAGVQIYKQYEKQYDSRAKALQAYNGAKNDTTMKYAKSVLALRDAFSAKAAASAGCGEAGYTFLNTRETLNKS